MATPITAAARGLRSRCKLDPRRARRRGRAGCRSSPAWSRRSSPASLAIRFLLRYLRTRSTERLRRLPARARGGRPRRLARLETVGRRRHGGHEAAPPAGDPRPGRPAPDPDPAGAGRRPPRARLPDDPGDDQPRRRRARARQGRPRGRPRPTRCRRASSRPRRPARTASGSCSPTCRSRSARRPAARHPDAARLGPRDRGGPGPGALAGGRGLDRRRRHGLRRLPDRASLQRVQAPPPRRSPARPSLSTAARRGVFDTPRAARVGYRAGRTSGAPATRGAWSSFLYLDPADRPSGPVTHRGAQTVNNKPTYLSKDGLEKLRAELDEMVTVKRPEVAQRIHDAKEHGDLTENAEYEDAKNEQAFVEGRIQTLEALIKNATIIDENHSTDHVQIGSTVDGRERRRRGDVHDRRLDRGQADRGPDQQREPGRPRAARQEEGREGRRQGPGRRLHLQDRRDQLGRRPPARSPIRRTHEEIAQAMDWADELAASVSGPAGRQRLEDAVGDRPRRQPARARHPRRHRRARCARAASRRRSSTASTTSTRWTPRRS